MAIKVVFPAGKDSITVSGLYQWDYGQQLEIEAEGLPTVVEVHFSCISMTEAIIRHCVFENGVGTVSIPDDCLEQASPITAWIYEYDVTQGKTLKVITLPVIERTRPNVVRDIPENIADEYTELIARLNKVVTDLENGVYEVAKAESAEYAKEAETVTGSVAEASFATRASMALNDYDGNPIKSTYFKRADRPQVIHKAANALFSKYVYSDTNESRMPVGAMLANKTLDNVVAIGFSFVYTDPSDQKEYTMEAHGIKSTPYLSETKIPVIPNATSAFIACNIALSNMEAFTTWGGANSNQVVGHQLVELTRLQSGDLYFRFIASTVRVDEQYISVPTWNQNCTLKDLYIYVI